MDYYLEENTYVEDHFDLHEIIAFEYEHKVEVTRGEDYQYVGWIDGKGYGLGLTFMGALVNAIARYKLNK